MDDKKLNMNFFNIMLKIAFLILIYLTLVQFDTMLLITTKSDTGKKYLYLHSPIIEIHENILFMVLFMSQKKLKETVLY